MKPGGRLIYSTCSIEKAENTDVVQHFLDSEAGKGFKLDASKSSYPWETGHDGAGAFRLIREADS